jgi:hypothetical protein
VRVLRETAVDTSPRFLSRNVTSLSFVALEKSIGPARDVSDAGVNKIECWYRKSKGMELTGDFTLKMNILEGTSKTLHQSPYPPSVIFEIPRTVESPKVTTVRQVQ